MAHRLKLPEGRALYALRKQTERVFGLNGGISNPGAGNLPPSTVSMSAASVVMPSSD
jgi:hypothetical protein